MILSLSARSTVGKYRLALGPDAFDRNRRKMRAPGLADRSGLRVQAGSDLATLFVLNHRGSPRLPRRSHEV